MKVVRAFLVLSVALTSCSSEPSQPKKPASSYAFNGGTITGFHGNIAKSTTTHQFSLVPPVYAQTTTVTLTGTYTGYSPLLQNNTSNVPIAWPIYGVGTFLPTCENISTEGTTPCPFGTARGSMDPGQALASQINSTTIVGTEFAPGLVTGNGSLGPLVVYAYTYNSTVPAGSSLSDSVEVWVIRNGQVLNSNISCPIPVQTTFPNNTVLQERCESASTFALQDGDGIFATITLNPDDQVIALSFFVVKA